MESMLLIQREESGCNVRLVVWDPGSSELSIRVEVLLYGVFRKLMMVSIKSVSSDFSRASLEMLFLVTCTMQSIRRLREVACPLAAFGGSMYVPLSPFNINVATGMLYRWFIVLEFSLFHAALQISI